MDCSPPGSSVRGVSRERILAWVAISYCRGSSRLRGQTQVSCIAGRFFTNGATREAYLSLESESVTCQLCHTLCYPMDCSPPGFSVHGIPPGKHTKVGNHSPLQGSSQLRDQTQVSHIVGGFFFFFNCLSHQGSPRGARDS